MASPPFNLDITDPTDNAIGSGFPANERTFRDNVNSYLNTEHDINTGYHAFQELTTTEKNALTSPPTGMIVYDTTLSQGQINTGTAVSPTWTNITSVLPFVVANVAKTANYQILAADNEKLFNNTGASGSINLTLPNTSTISVGYYVMFQTLAAQIINVKVQGGHSEIINFPQGQTLSTLVIPANIAENAMLVYDGTDWFVLACTYDVMTENGAITAPTVPVGISGQAYTSNGTFTIPSGVTSCKVTMVAGGGAGSQGANGLAIPYGGGAGGGAIVWLSGLTGGNTIAVTVGAGGSAPGGNGGNSVISSGTESITTTTCTGGGGSSDNTAGAGGNASGGVDMINFPGGQGQPGGSVDGLSGTWIATAGAGGVQGLCGLYGSGGCSGGTNGGSASNGESGLVMFEWFHD